MYLTSVCKWGKALCSGGGVIFSFAVCGGGKETPPIGYFGRWEVGASEGKSRKGSGGVCSYFTSHRR